MKKIKIVSLSINILSALLASLYLFILLTKQTFSLITYSFLLILIIDVLFTSYTQNKYGKIKYPSKVSDLRFILALVSFILLFPSLFGSKGLDFTSIYTYFIIAGISVFLIFKLILTYFDWKYYDSLEVKVDKSIP